MWCMRDEQNSFVCNTGILEKFQIVYGDVMVNSYFGNKVANVFFSSHESCIFLFLDILEMVSLTSANEYMIALFN